MSEENNKDKVEPQNTWEDGEDLGQVGSDAQQTGEVDAVSPPQPDPLAELKEALLRTRAEMDNLEKRSQREIEKARRFMFEGIFKDLLPVIDGLDQGIEATAKEDQSGEGLALTRKLLMQTLERHGLSEINPEQEPFDPAWHEAMTAQPDDSVPAETVLQVLQKGYRLNDRLLRPARVVISSQGE